MLWQIEATSRQSDALVYELYGLTEDEIKIIEGRPMKTRHDPEVDALHISSHDTTVTTQHLAKGIAADDDAEGNLADIEIPDAQARFGARETLEQVSLEDIPTQGLVRGQATALLTGDYTMRGSAERIVNYVRRLLTMPVTMSGSG